MKIDIICVGKLKEKYWASAIEEYTKRLLKYCKLEIIEVPDEKAPENLSARQEIQVKEKEGEAILKKLKDEAYTIALAIEGKMYTSTDLARHIENLSIQGKSHIAFIIGGSLGLSDQVLNRANEKLSFSPLTFPHQLARVMLLEQVYRSFRIIKGEPYHK